MTLFIKNMVCDRCILAVKKEMKEMRLRPTAKRLGMTDFRNELNKEQLTEISKRLKALGFEILPDKKTNW